MVTNKSPLSAVVVYIQIILFNAQKHICHFQLGFLFCFLITTYITFSYLNVDFGFVQGDHSDWIPWSEAQGKYFWVLDKIAFHKAYFLVSNSFQRDVGFNGIWAVNVKIYSS